MNTTITTSPRHALAAAGLGVALALAGAGIATLPQASTAGTSPVALAAEAAQDDQGAMSAAEAQSWLGEARARGIMTDADGIGAATDAATFEGAAYPLARIAFGWGALDAAPDDAAQWLAGIAPAAWQDADGDGLLGDDEAQAQLTGDELATALRSAGMQAFGMDDVWRASSYPTEAQAARAWCAVRGIELPEDGSRAATVGGGRPLPGGA